MKHNKTFIVKYRRKREGKTDYHKRLKLLLGETPRLVVRKTKKNILVQISEFSPKGDKVLVSAHTKELEKKGWKASRKNLSAAYLCGLLAAKKALAKGLKKAIADFGTHTPIKGSALYAAIKGALDGGLDIPVSPDVLPSEERISGKHVSDYANKLKENKEEYERQFSHYLKSNISPEEFHQHVTELKKKLEA